MHKIIELLLRAPFLVLALTMMTVLGGVIAWMRLPIDAFPDVTNVQVMVLTEAPGLSAVDIEQQVTYPIEMQMGGVPKVQQVRSLSKSGLSQVVIVFEDNVNIYFARQQIFERLQAAKENLPPSVEPELGPISTGLGEIFQYTLENETLSPMELRTLQDFLIAPPELPHPSLPPRLMNRISPGKKPILRERRRPARPAALPAARSRSRASAGASALHHPWRWLLSQCEIAGARRAMTRRLSSVERVLDQARYDCIELPGRTIHAIVASGSSQEAIHWFGHRVLPQALAEPARWLFVIQRNQESCTASAADQFSVAKHVALRLRLPCECQPFVPISDEEVIRMAVFELKYFFNSGLSSDNCESIASESVKNKIKELLQQEDPHKPRSDQDIADLLKGQGINIARRTVTKYREMIGILSSSKRRKDF